MLGVIGMAQVWAGAGFIVGRLEARLHAGGGEPQDGAFFGVAHFGAAAAGQGFMAVAVTSGGRNGAQPNGHVTIEGSHWHKDTGDQREEANAEARARDGGGKLPAHGPCCGGTRKKPIARRVQEKALLTF